MLQSRKHILVSFTPKFSPYTKQKPIDIAMDATAMNTTKEVTCYLYFFMQFCLSRTLKISSRRTLQVVRVPGSKVCAVTKDHSTYFMRVEGTQLVQFTVSFVAPQLFIRKHSIVASDAFSIGCKETLHKHSHYIVYPNYMRKH